MQHDVGVSVFLLLIAGVALVIAAIAFFALRGRTRAEMRRDPSHGETQAGRPQHTVVGDPDRDRSPRPTRR